MRIIFEDMALSDFPAWAGAREIKQAIEDAEKDADFESLIAELFPEGISAQSLNDLLWNDYDWLFEQLGIEDEDDD